jgi:N-6 DNA Methylase
MSVSPTPTNATDVASISLEQIISSFKQSVIDRFQIDTPQAIDNFIDGSRQTLNHLKLAALSQVLEARSRNKNISDRATLLHSEWIEAARDFTQRINYDIISKPVFEAISQLTPRVGALTSAEIYGISKVVKEASRKTMGLSRFSATMLPLFENWLDRALHINSALLRQQFDAADPFRIVQAYQVWSERQSDQEDVKPEVFAEQVAYVFFVRLLLVRVLEDKRIISPRLASDGGFLEWSSYIARHFQELDGIGILNENFTNILARKASNSYLHFFQQAVFDWFDPDDFLLVETLEFLCRYNFHNITSDIIGFTYEAYIERNARDRKGHFLTRHDVVEYMLDPLDYTGPQIIGRSILDPASGSGSFLVQAARRYRKALVTYFCNSRGLPDSEDSLQSNAELRKEFASRYVQDLTNSFYGMELNPFACYLAEMNLLIQALDDLFVLQQAGEMQPIDRFHIYNTDSLDLPREILDRPDLNKEANRISVPDRLSNRLTDDAYPLKAMLDSYADGFSYIVSNPPYVSSKQEELDTARFRNAEFYKVMLSGDMNLYLLFLRLGQYYLADFGQMIYIVPLTIFGDKSASAARKQLKTAPFSPSVVVRFYRGDILFPGVDQAVAIVRVNRSQPGSSILVSGGNTIQEARASQFSVPLEDVIEAVPHNHIWQGNWLVAQSLESFAIWQHVKSISANLANQLGTFLDETFDRKQGDINATILNPLRLGDSNGSFSNGDVAIYKGEDVRPFSPLPTLPSDWAKPSQTDTQLPRESQYASEVLEQLKQIVGSERGIVLREVARLNTRERLTATWFERTKVKPVAFTHELWRMILKESATEEYGKALLAIIHSNVAAYLVNLFSTNNHVSKDELGRMPIPDPERMPVTQLAKLANEMLNERAIIEKDFVLKYGAKLPEFDDGNVYIPPSTFLAATRLPKLSIAALVGRGEVKNNGPVNGRIRALRARNLIISSIDPTKPNAAAFAQILELFLYEPGRENDSWSEAQNWQLPDSIAAKAWLGAYQADSQQAQASWNKFIALQQQIDEVVADWYGFNTAQRSTIREGLPWARRRRNHLL